MKFLKYTLGTLVLLLVIALGAGAFVISRSAECPTAPPSPGSTGTMRGILHLCYGSPEALFYTDIARPEPGPGEIRVSVEAAGVNPLDWHTVRGSPYIMRLSSGLNRPGDPRFGVDFAGTVEAVGEGVSRFEVGQRVFGGYPGAFAQFLVMPEDRAVAPLPQGISFAEGAAVGVAATTALQALRDHGQLQPGQKVLINGASGGVGTFAVQIAANMGAEVYGVCSTRNVQRVRALGAQHVYDYTREDYTQGDQRFDLIVDMVGNHSPAANAGVLKPDGKLVIVGGAKGDWLGPLMGPVKALLSAPFVEQEMVILLARLKSADMIALADLLASGAVVPVIDRSFALSETAQAVAYSETGRARGKIILQVGGSDN